MVLSRLYSLIDSSTFQDISKLNFGMAGLCNYLINNSSSPRLYDGPDIMLFNLVAWGVLGQSVLD